MKFEKSVLYRFCMPYALGWMVKDGQPCVVGATESHGPIVISRPPYTSAEVLVDGPGGCMSLVSNPDVPGELYAIMGCFLGYNFHGGAVYRIEASGGSVGSEKIADLPFAHRMEVVSRPEGPTLVVANLASSKDSPQDWTRPGNVYALALRSPQRPDGTLQAISNPIHKNHGFLKTNLHDRPTILVSGMEGLFSMDPEGELKPVLEQEVSEVAVYDLDGDGVQEMVTIEPFHGNVLAVYKVRGGSWVRVWQTELDYGHCVLADTIGGRPSIVVSNRAGDKSLLLFQFETKTPGVLAEPTRTVIEAGVGAANMLIVHEPEELIFATNQVEGELVRYRVLSK